MRTYEAFGDEDGSCGHEHSTPSAAAACAYEYARACEAAGRYSDRRVRSTGVAPILLRALAIPLAPAVLLWDAFRRG